VSESYPPAADGGNGSAPESAGNDPIIGINFRDALTLGIARIVLAKTLAKDAVTFDDVRGSRAIWLAYYNAVRLLKQARIIDEVPGVTDARGREEPAYCVCNIGYLASGVMDAAFLAAAEAAHREFGQ